jgi:hypothetical protein
MQIRLMQSVLQDTIAMRKNYSQYLCVCLALVALISSSFGQTLADVAEEAVRSAKESHYQHKTHVDQAAGIFDLDCSGFVDYLLKRIAPRQYTELPIEPGHVRPRAVAYYEFLATLPKKPTPGWEPVHRFSDLRPGDLIAWKKELTAAETGDTGHVMIVAEVPALTAKGRYRATVFDSTKTPHDDDTRPAGGDGIGRGDLFFYVDTEDRPVAFQFSSQRKVHDAPISMGRIAN